MLKKNYQCWGVLIVKYTLCLQTVWIAVKRLKMAIFNASVHTHDVEFDTCMNMSLKYNTCIIKPHIFNYVS